MKKSFKFIFFFFFSISILLLFTSATIPKFLILDRLVSKIGAFTVAENVKESWNHIHLYRGKVLLKGEILLEFDSFSFSLFPFPSAFIECGEGTLRVNFFIWGITKVRGEMFNCISGIQIEKIELDLGEGIHGKAILKLKDMVDKLVLEFKGRNFEGEIHYMGTVLKGGGVIELNFKNPLKTKLNAEFSGSGLRFVVSGTLGNLNFNFR